MESVLLIAISGLFSRDCVVDIGHFRLGELKEQLGLSSDPWFVELKSEWWSLFL